MGYVPSDHWAISYGSWPKSQPGPKCMQLYHCIIVLGLWFFRQFLIGGLEHLLFSHIFGIISQLTNSYFSEG